MVRKHFLDLCVHIATAGKLNKKTCSQVINATFKNKSITYLWDLNLPDVIKFRIDYPMHQDCIGKCKVETVGELVWEIARLYKKIYSTTWCLSGMDYEKLSKKKKEKYDNCPNPYGIWGHLLEDLCLEGLTWNPKEKIFELSVGS